MSDGFIATDNHFQMIYTDLNGDFSEENVSRCIRGAEKNRDINDHLGKVNNFPAQIGALDQVRAYYRSYGFEKLIEKIKSEAKLMEDQICERFPNYKRTI